MKNDPNHRGQYLRVINFLIENSPVTPLWTDLYHYLFSLFMFGNPHQSPKEMARDKHVTSNSFIVASTENSEYERLKVKGKDLSNMFFVNVQADIMRLRQQAKEVSDKKVFRLSGGTEE